MQPRTILHLIPSLSRGGAGRSLIATAKYSATGGAWRHGVATLEAADPAAAILARDAGITVIDRTDRDALRGAIAAADVVHVHFWNHPALYDLLQSDLPPMRLLLWLHVAGDQPPQVITRPLLEFADCVLATSSYTLELPVLRDLPLEQRAKVAGTVAGAPDFARLAGIQPRPHPTFNVGYIGTVDFAKMHPDYVTMSARIGIADVQFIVCGSGSGFGALKHQAQELGVAARFDLRGYVEDIRSVLEILDVFGYPLCADNYAAAELILQEAMYAGVPPVLFPYGAAPRIVIHNETGLIVQSAEEYRQAVEWLYQHPAERARLGRGAHHQARQQGAEQAAQQIAQLYERLLARPKRRRTWGERSAGGQPAPLRAARAAAGLPGAARFIQSLGGAAPQFALSLRGQNVEEVLDAERQISVSSPALASAGGGGILQYRAYYPRDGHLRLWSGLVLQQWGRPALATGEFAAARALGCAHWRVSWYLAQAAAQVGAQALAQAAIGSVLQAAPEFAAARAWQAGQDHHG